MSRYLLKRLLIAIPGLLGISIRTLRNKLAEYRSRGHLVLARESEN